MKIKSKWSKCTVVFLTLMIVSVSTYAFFQQMMQMPQQMMHMMSPQQPCVCKCDTQAK